jgi:hypothetical protein
VNHYRKQPTVCVGYQVPFATVDFFVAVRTGLNALTVNYYNAWRIPICPFFYAINFADFRVFPQSFLWKNSNKPIAILETLRATFATDSPFY